MNKKQFIKSCGATCKNWSWSWSYVNHEKRFVIFGAWVDGKRGDDFLILAQNWQFKPNGEKQSGYGQSQEHIQLIIQEKYDLKVFFMEAEDVNMIPRKIKLFGRELYDKSLSIYENNMGIKEYYACDEEFRIPEEINDDENYKEGLSKQIKVNVYERNPDARKRCIEAHGYNCWTCNFNFEEFYGSEIGKRYIHVHHKILISSIKKEYVIDPIKDLVPICPNCHSMIHRRSKNPMDIHELRKLIKNRMETF